MKDLKTKYIIYFILIALAGILVGWILGSSNQEAEVVGEEVVEDLAKEAGDEVIWTCSMHPQIQQKEPGDCPICGMELIPLEESVGEDNPYRVHMSPTAMQLASIQTAEANNMEPVKTVRLDGKVQPDERLVYSQSSHIPGRIERLTVNFTGEYVDRGSPIAYIYSPELETAQEELLEAKKIKDTQPALFNAAREKLKNWKLSDYQIDQILESGSIREQFPVLADVSGYVMEKMVDPGDYVKQGQTIYKISDLSRVWVMFDVYESDMPWISEGDEVHFSVESVPGEDFTGKISYLDPVIDPRTRVAKARVEVTNDNLKLKPEMFVSGTVTAALPGQEKALTVPKSAVMWTGERSIVYVKSEAENGVDFLMREVKLGPALGDSYVIEEGLNAGEEIAVNGTFSIDAAAQLSGKRSMMNESAGKSKEENQHAEVSKQGNIESASSQTVDENFKQQLTEVYYKYLEMKNSFVASDAEQVSKDAEKTLNRLNQVDMELLKGDAHMHWMNQLKILKKTLQTMISNTDIEIQRGAFAEFNQAFYKSVKEFGLKDITAYYQFCPMASDNQGSYWFSEDKEIKNPYFGESMLSCGETRETLGYN